jgi:hypothetical protein
MVGADSAVCPRCGARFRAVLIRRSLRWAIMLALTGWLVAHFALKWV